MKNLGIYTGLRFTTVTFALQLASKVTKVANPTVGDIVVWSVPQHMGVVDGPDSFYSALNHAEGIRSASISGMGGSPRFYRIKGPNVSTFIDPTLGLARTIPTAPLGQM
jgi:cell wall-associated NlpC family hydrolase